MFAQNMQRIEINVLYKRTVCQVGQLPESTVKQVCPQNESGQDQLMTAYK